jgi:hypothetical protein
MTSEHPPIRSARPEIDPHDPPDALRPEDGPEGRDPGEQGHVEQGHVERGALTQAPDEQGPDEQPPGASGVAGEMPRPQPSGGP